MAAAALTLVTDYTQMHPTPGQQIVRGRAAATGDFFISRFKTIHSVQATPETSTALTGPAITVSGGQVTIAWTGLAADVYWHLLILGEE